MGKNYDDPVKEWCSTIAKQLWKVIIMYYGILVHVPYKKRKLINSDNELPVPLVYMLT